MPTWTQAIAVGHSVIDQQHKELFARADDLLEAMHAGRGSAEVKEVLAFLKDYVREHFGMEEGLMAQHRYRGAAIHKLQHAEFQRRFREDEAEFERAGPNALVVMGLRDLLRGWLVNHVSTMDLELSGFLRESVAAAAAR